MANPVWRTDRSAPAVGQLALIADTGPIRWYQEQLSLLYHEHLDQRGEFRHGLCSALFHTIAAQIVLNSSDFPRPSYTRNDIQRLCGEIKANPTRRFRLAELARMAGLSPRRLSRVFRAEVGTTPKEYEIRTRLAYAEFLLSNQGMKVSEVATACGYPDPFLFSRQFKQHTGRTPSRTRVHGRR
jgi:AraC-like DNA-binding protein